MKKSAFISILLIIVFALSFSACSSVNRGVQDGISTGIAGKISGGGSGGKAPAGGGSSPDRNYSGSKQAVPWPEPKDWKEYGLESLKQPAGTVVEAVQFINPSSQGGLFGVGNLYSQMGLTKPFYEVYLINGGRPAFDNLEKQILAIGTVSKDQDYRDSGSLFKAWTLKTGNGVWLYTEVSNGDVYIRVTQIGK